MATRVCKYWTDEDVAEAQKLRSEGMEFHAIAAKLDRSVESIRGKLKYLQQTTQSVPPEAMKAMDDSSMRSEIERLKRQLDEMQVKSKPSRVNVVSDAEPPTDPSEMWHAAEADSAKRIEYAYKRSRFYVPKLEDKPVGLVFVSDQHIAPGTPVDFRRMREDAELIAETDGLYACLGGDGVDNHIKIRPAALAARSQPHDQWQLFEYYLSIFAEKIMLLISGNHDAWTDQIAGIDMVANIAKNQRLCYAPAEARANIEVGSQTYRIAVRHQYRYNSSFNQGHTVKQWYRMGEEAFDIGVICHHHEAHVEPFEAHGETRWVARPGSYQITSSYSRQFGFNSAVPTCPTFIVFPDRRHIVGFRDVRDAVRTLKAERGTP